MLYTSDYVRAVTAKLKAAPHDFLSKYRVDVEINDPPLIEQLKAMDEAAKLGGDMSVETKERLARACIKGREVKISYDGKLLGSFVTNSGLDPWDSFPVLKENPSSLSLLFDLCVSALMEKWLPPQVSAPPVAATPGRKG
jgi:hypothetical protein